MEQTITGEGTELEETRYMILEESKSMSGDLEISPAKISAGAESEVKLKMKLKNTGNTPLEDETVKIEIINKETEGSVKTDEMKVSLGLSEEKEFEKTLSLNLEIGVYEVKIKYKGDEIAEAELEAIEAITEEKEVSHSPKILFMNFIEYPYIMTKNLIKNVLKRENIEYRDSGTIMNSYINYQRGENTISIVCGNLSGMRIKNELRERVFRGEGLILIATNRRDVQWLEDVVGVRLKTIPGKNREKSVVFNPESGVSGGYVLKRKIRMRIVPLKSGVKVLSKTVKNGYPMISFRKYGKGKVVVISHPLEITGGVGNMREFIRLIVERINGDIYNKSGISRIIPLDIILENRTDKEKKLKIKEIFPYGVKGFDYNPVPDNMKKEKKENFCGIFFNRNEKNDEKINPEWQITLPKETVRKIRYWLKIEDKIGTYPVKSEIYENDIKVNELEIKFEVTEDILTRIDNIISDLDKLTVSGKDRMHVERAKKLLLKIRNKNTFFEGPFLYFANLDFSIRAGMELSKVKKVNIDEQRLKIGDLIMFYSRRVYEVLEDIPVPQKKLYIEKAS